MVQESTEMSQYHLSAEQAEEDSTVEEVPKIVTFATRYSKCEMHFNEQLKGTKTLCPVLTT